jgi:hypothetical protein
MTAQWCDLDTSRGIAIEQRVKTEDSFADCYNTLFPEVFHAGIGIALEGSDMIEAVEKIFSFDETDLINLLSTASMYVDKHGMVPFRKTKDGQLPEVVDFFSGKFVRRIEADGEIKYGWLTNLRNAEDSSVDIYIDPIHGPSMSENDPYRSLISTMLHHLEAMYWKRIDHAQMYYQLCHPPFGVMASTGNRANTKIDPSENSFIDAANAGAQGMSIVSASERRYNEETSETVDKHFNEAVSRSTVEGKRVQYAVNGTRVETYALQTWATRRVKMPDGYEPVAFQQPHYIPINEDEQALNMRIHRLLGVPLSDTGGGGNKLAANIAAQRESLKNSVARRRTQLRDIFKFVFYNFLQEALVSDLKDRKEVVYKQLNSHPTTYLEYYRWMATEEKLRDHPTIDTMIIQIEEERKRRFMEKIEQTTNHLLLEAEGNGVILDRDVVISHLMAIEKDTIEFGSIQTR